jgi:hypothetical protein
MFRSTTKVLCGGVAACYVQVRCVSPCTAHSTPGHNMVPHHRIIHNDVCNFTDCFNIIVTLARLRCKPSDDGRGPKQVGAILI